MENNSEDNFITVDPEQFYDMIYKGEMEDTIICCKEQDEQDIAREIKKTSPSDIIEINVEDAEFLEKLWNKKNVDIAHSIPSDVFYAGNVPLLDCIIKCYFELSGEKHTVEARTIIFEDYKETIKRQADNEIVIIGALIPQYPQHATNGFFFFPIYAKRGIDAALFFNIGFYGEKQKLMEYVKSALGSERGILYYANGFLHIWYSIQIALLHPTVKTVFQHPETERIYNPSHDKKKDKRVTCYVKKHVIKSGDVESAMRSGDHNFTRKTMVWYVIGHWRTYSDGRKVFVYPYWKGPLRDLKQNTDEGRERKIAIGGESV